MKLKKCEICKSYTLNENCSKCNSKTKDAHYKFVHIRGIREKEIYSTPQ